MLRGKGFECVNDSFSSNLEYNLVCLVVNRGLAVAKQEDTRSQFTCAQGRQPPSAVRETTLTCHD